MRLLVIAALLLAASPLAVPVADACHPDLAYTTPTRPSATVSHGMSCDHRSFYACIATSLGETCLVHVAP